MDGSTVSTSTPFDEDTPDFPDFDEYDSGISAPGKNLRDFDGFFDWLDDAVQHDSGIHAGRGMEGGRRVVRLTFNDHHDWDYDVADGSKDRLEDSMVREWVRVFEKMDGMDDGEGGTWRFLGAKLLKGKWGGDSVVLTLAD
jgi:hypothetical protein